MKTSKIYQGDCLEVLRTLPDNSVDSVVTDPPYGIGFMGKAWDTFKPRHIEKQVAYRKEQVKGTKLGKKGTIGSAAAQAGLYDLSPKGVRQYQSWCEEWARECLRVLKPGGHLLASNSPRMYHRMTSGIEDGGFEIRDTIAWCYGSGFPKSHNLHGDWEGWGSALKPAFEPIVVARKPFKGTLKNNVETHGTGGLNIDGCRVGTEEITTQGGDKFKGNGIYGKYEICEETKHSGRWPANLIHDGSEEVLECFPNTKPSKANLVSDNRSHAHNKIYGEGKGWGERNPENSYTDSGSAARFFYCAKASKKDRDEGLDGTITVKYNGSINTNKELCKEENMVAVQLLQRVISEPELVSFSIGESGVNIMAQCQSGSLSTIKTTISKIIESKILNLLMLSLTSGFTEDASLEKTSGGSHAESVESLRKWILTTTNGQSVLAHGASDVALKMLLQIRNEENWNQSKNIHSTVKPTALMRYLVKLVTPPGGTVLDPFTGSGSTGKACKLEGMEFIGIEREEEYVKIARSRIENTKLPPQPLL